MKAKKGFLHALKATARKIAVIYYRILTKGLAFVEHGIQLYQQKFKEHQSRLLQKKQNLLGYNLSRVDVISSNWLGCATDIVE